MYYIENQNTEQIFCPTENKFFPCTVEPIGEDLHILQELIKDDPKRFENCKIKSL